MPKKTGKPVEHPEEKHESLGMERLLFFSDAVFAIAITLLALEIRLPAVEGALSNDELAQTLLALWPKYLSYVISFLVIGGFWIGHHRKFQLIQGYDGNLVMLNMILLMFVAFIPFPTAVISEYGNRTATIFYALIIALTGLLSASLWWYAAYHDHLIDPHLDPQRRRRQAWGPLLIPAVFLLSIGLAFINDDLAKFSWALTAVLSPFIR